MNKELTEYLKKEFRLNNLPRYQKYFDEWISGLTSDQIYYYKKLWLMDGDSDLSN